MRVARSMLLVCTVGLPLVAAAVFAACSGDDAPSSETLDASGIDSSKDTGRDTNASLDTGSDSPADSGPSDAGSDAYDAAFDAYDAGPMEAGAFVSQIAQIYCQNLQVCCLAKNPAKPFGLGGCIQSRGAKGDFPFNFWGIESNYGPYVRDGGKLTYDEAKAKSCLAAVQNFPACGPVTTATMVQTTATCLGALKGTMAANAPGCRKSSECSAGNYCDMTIVSDAGPGTGVCKAFKTIGQVCFSNAECGDLLSGIPNHCKFADPFNDISGTCQAQEATNALCLGTNQDCQSQICAITPDGGKFPYVDGGPSGLLGEYCYATDPTDECVNYQ